MRTGAVIDAKYEIVARLGEGGMGKVYAAKNVATGRSVALKVMTDVSLVKNASMVGRFRREARAAGLIMSRHVAQVLDAGTDATTGHPYIVMELLKGEDLEHALARRSTLPPDVVARIAIQGCIALKKAHEAGVVHRDLKPANLFLTREDDEIVVKVLDFGIAKLSEDAEAHRREAALTQTGAIMGSPMYMSPEQARGVKVDQRTDLWSLGMVMYEALAGAPAYHHCESASALFIAIATEPPPPLRDRAPHVPDALAAVVHRALMQDVAQRFSSADEMLTSLRSFVPGSYAMYVAMIGDPEPEPPPPSSLELRITPGPPDARLLQTVIAGGPGDTGLDLSTTSSSTVRRVGISFATLVFLALVVGVGITIRHVQHDATRATYPAPSVSGGAAGPAPVEEPVTPEVAAVPPPTAATPMPPPPAPAASVHMAPRPRAVPSSARPAVPAVNCDPPTWTDERGHVHMKEGCI